MRIFLTAVAMSVSFSALAQSSSEEVELRALVPYLENPDLAPPDIPRNSCSARLVGYALLYRQHPNKFRNAFFAELVIDDYADRAAGKYNYVDRNDVADTIDSASTAPGGIENRRISAAVGFCALKTRNLWVTTPDAGSISLARVLRGIALSSLLEGTDEDALGIANAVDALTAQRAQPGS